MKTQILKEGEVMNNSKTEWVDIRTLTPNPHWKMIDEKMDWRLGRGRNDKCWCDSEKKYKQCCMNRRPIEQLEHLGHKVLRYDDGKVIVLVGKSDNLFEGVCSPMDTTKVEENMIGLCEIEEEKIRDYNSLWYMTKSGWWHTDGKYPFPIYPFINVDGEWWRWDNSSFLRPLCMTFKWSPQNKLMYQTTVMMSMDKGERN